MNNTKLLLLDFDGTLAPIVKLPREAKLPSETKKLLQQLSEKKGVYIAIISGRKLDDIKEKIGLQNIIYGGNHGLEGEFFGEKYSLPVPDKMLLTLKTIKKQMTQIAAEFKGVLIEDKDLTLSIHYRLANKQQVPEIKLLISRILKPYIVSKLISIIEEKKVIDIIPNLKCNKGSFAALIIKKITDRIKTRPEVIIIGDDRTDEDIFQKFKKGISFRVGIESNSKAKYRLKDIKAVFEFLKYINLAVQINNVWRGLVRDVSGRWLKYHQDGIKYFKYGTQPEPDLTNKEQFHLMESSIASEKVFIKSLQNKSFKDIKGWLIKLHKIQAYKGRKGKMLTERRVSRGEHSNIVKLVILSLARKYADPYLNKGIQTLYLPDISAAGLPRDQWRNSDNVIHYYPDPKFFDQYLSVMEKTLEEFMENINNADKYKLFLLIARYYQYAINMHMFEHVNQTLFCNQLNTMLKLIGLNPIEHGVLDFAAMRLQPESFAKYFIDEVKTNAKF